MFCSILTSLDKSNFFQFFFQIYKCLKILQLNITKTKKRKLQKRARERYQGLSKEEKKKRHYGHEQCKTFPEDKKQRLMEYRKNEKKCFFMINILCSIRYI